jgi:ribosome-associated protein
VKQKNISLEGERLIGIAAQSAFDKKAEKTVVLDLRGQPGPADWFLICEGDNTMHCRAIADAIQQDLALHSTLPWHAEGQEQGRWILLDYSETVIHIMLPDIRKYYGLENLWQQCPRQELTDPADLPR